MTTASTTTATAGSTGTPGPSRRPMSDGDYSYDPTDYPDDRSFENRMAELDFRDAWATMTDAERDAIDQAIDDAMVPLSYADEPCDPAEFWVTDDYDPITDGLEAA